MNALIKQPKEIQPHDRVVVLLSIHALERIKQRIGREEEPCEITKAIRYKNKHGKTFWAVPIRSGLYSGVFEYPINLRISANTVFCVRTVYSLGMLKTLTKLEEIPINVVKQIRKKVY